MVVHAFITNKLDLYNILLAGIPLRLLQKLQLVQNAAARLIMQARKYDHVTTLLKTLHWLPVSCRIHFKILLTTFKALNGKGPKYIQDLLLFYTPSRSLHSGSQPLLCERRTHTKTGERAFSVIAPKLWNNLPSHIRSTESMETFKKLVKTHLFTSHFS